MFSTLELMVKRIEKKNLNADKKKKTPLPFDSSLSSGCLRAVMSRKVHKKRTTTSRSFLMGAICNSSHNGEPVYPR